MRILTCSVMVVALAAISYSPLRGQAVDATQVLTAAREALGGEKKLSAVRSFTATGRTRQIRGNNLVPIEFEINCELPDRFVRTDEFPAQDADPTTQGFSGDDLIQVPSGRNSLRASRQTTINMQVAYQFAFGRSAPLPPGIGVFGGGGAVQVRTFDQGNARYRLQVFIQAQNLTNEANYLGYSGTLTSPFFGKPTAVSGMRKIDAGINLNF